LVDEVVGGDEEGPGEESPVGNIRFLIYFFH
jgi:hypothetical protein